MLKDIRNLLAATWVLTRSKPAHAQSTHHHYYRRPWTPPHPPLPER